MRNTYFCSSMNPSYYQEDHCFVLFFYGPQLHNLASLAFAATAEVFEDIKSLYTPDAKRHKNAKCTRSKLSTLATWICDRNTGKRINEKVLTGHFEGSWYKHLLVEMLKHSPLQMHFGVSVRQSQALLQMLRLICHQTEEQLVWLSGDTLSYVVDIAAVGNVTSIPRSRRNWMMCLFAVWSLENPTTVWKIEGLLFAAWHSHSVWTATLFKNCAFIVHQAELHRQFHCLLCYNDNEFFLEHTRAQSAVKKMFFAQIICTKKDTSSV